MEQSTVKPKRVLTEAQRLAFLKGREKRLANIETRRMEKLEAMENAVQEDDMPPPAPKKKPRTTKVKVKTESPTAKKIQEPEPDPEPEPEPKTEPKSEPETKETKETKQSETGPTNIDAIIQEVMSRMKEKESVSTPIPKQAHKRPYVRRQPPVNIPQTPPDSPPPPPSRVATKDFNWM